MSDSDAETRLRAERDAARDHTRELSEDAREAIESLEVECDALRTALQTYGQHLADCDYWGTGLLPGAMKPDASRCDCGFDAALAAPVAPPEQRVRTTTMEDFAEYGTTKPAAAPVAPSEGNE